MKYKSLFFILILCSFHFPTFVIAESIPAALTPQAMINLLQEAKLYAESVGKDAALLEFSKPNGQFTRGELYVYAYDFQGKLLASGAQPDLVGKNFLSLKDVEGRELIKILRDKATTGLGTLEYQWINPVTKTVMPKLGFVLKIDESYWIGSGVYTHSRDHQETPL